MPTKKSSSTKASSSAKATKDKTEDKTEDETSAKSKAKEKPAETSSIDDVVEELSDTELLKQKKKEAKAKKETEKEEKKEAREARKLAPQKAMVRQTQHRNLLKIHGKKYRAAEKKLEKGKLYALTEAIKLVKDTATTKFDSSVEVHVRLGIDTKKSDQVVRSTVALPHGTGKKLRVIAFVASEQAATAKKAGAVEAGEDDLVEKISKGWLDFDVAIATPDMMKKIGKIAKTLGQKGLMPNPKAGTVTPDIEQAILEIQKGKVEFRNDGYGILHNMIGKVSFDEAKLAENLKAYLRAILEAKPKTVKGIYIKSLSLASSMGPGIIVDANEALKEI